MVIEAAAGRDVPLAGDALPAGARLFPSNHAPSRDRNRACVGIVSMTAVAATTLGRKDFALAKT